MVQSVRGKRTSKERESCPGVGVVHEKETGRARWAEKRKEKTERGSLAS